MSSTSPPPPPSPNKPQPSQHAFQAPTGTRDFYPAELNRLRYIQDAWRRTSINHGFEEIDGPTFEHLELYTAKSGEGIVSELFSFERFGGEKTFALRPEFTPTLARMYASKAASLPKPTKWFWQQNCYRAERPQRGRLREFCQWNCDILGLPPHDENDPQAVLRAKAQVDVELLECVVGLLTSAGLTASDVSIRFNDREFVSRRMRSMGIPPEAESRVLALIDARSKLDDREFQARLQGLGLTREQFDKLTPAPCVGEGAVIIEHDLDEMLTPIIDAMPEYLTDWVKYDPTIVRGLAYYTGMVFEVIASGERAVAGGGRYDKLIETFGGPPTPAVGFGMGDVVLSLVLQDKGLMPSDDQIAEKLGLRPDALVISNGTPEADAQIAPTLAALRRANLHARRSYKTTRNVGKLIQDAAKARARYCVIIESAATAQLKNMDTQEQRPVPLAELSALIAQR